MPRIKSAIKRVKTSEKSHSRNISYKTKIKTNVKKCRLALSEKNEEDALKYFKDSVSTLDKAVSKGIIHKGTASRNKSKLAKKLSVLSVTAPELESQEAVKVKEKPKVKKATKTVKKIKVKDVSKTAKKPRVKKATKTVTAKKKTTKKSE